jgi:hypothetical protein
VAGEPVELGVVHLENASHAGVLVREAVEDDAGGSPLLAVLRGGQVPQRVEWGSEGDVTEVEPFLLLLVPSVMEPAICLGVDEENLAAGHADDALRQSQGAVGLAGA